MAPLLNYSLYLGLIPEFVDNNLGYIDLEKEMQIQLFFMAS